MQRDTGQPVSALVNQATFLWLSQNGYELPLSLGAVLRDVVANTGDVGAANSPSGIGSPSGFAMESAVLGQRLEPTPLPSRGSGTFGSSPEVPTLFVKRENDVPIRIASERFMIGRGPQCDLIIASPRVSREHALITKSNGAYVIKDLGSSNGTWLDSERVVEHVIQNGDKLILGTEPISFILKA